MRKTDPVNQSYFITKTIHIKVGEILQKETGKCIVYNLDMQQLEIQLNKIQSHL